MAPTAHGRAHRPTVGESLGWNLSNASTPTLRADPRGRTERRVMAATQGCGGSLRAPRQPARADMPASGCGTASARPDSAAGETVAGLVFLRGGQRRCGLPGESGRRPLRSAPTGRGAAKRVRTRDAASRTRGERARTRQPERRGHAETRGTATPPHTGRRVTGTRPGNPPGAEASWPGKDTSLRRQHGRGRGGRRRPRHANRFHKTSVRRGETLGTPMFPPSSRARLRGVSVPTERDAALTGRQAARDGLDRPPRWCGQDGRPPGCRPRKRTREEGGQGHDVGPRSRGHTLTAR